MWDSWLDSDKNSYKEHFFEEIGKIWESTMWPMKIKISVNFVKCDNSIIVIQENDVFIFGYV